MNPLPIGDEQEVERVCLLILEEHGIESESEACNAVREMTAFPEALLTTPSHAQLVEAARRDVENVVEALAERYDSFPQSESINNIERELLGAIGLGLEGKLKGPEGAPRPIRYASEIDSPEWAATAASLPETGLPVGAADDYAWTVTTERQTEVETDPVEFADPPGSGDAGTTETGADRSRTNTELRRLLAEALEGLDPEEAASLLVDDLEVTPDPETLQRLAERRSTE